MSRVRISRLDSNRDNQPRGVDLEWAELADMLGQGGVPARPCALDTCGTGEHLYRWVDRKGVEHAKGCRHKYGAAWSPAVYPPGATRANRHVGVVSLLVIDFDHLPDDVLETAYARVESYRHVAHPSHSDRPGDRCWRVVVALSEPVLADDWPRFWVTALHKLGLATIRVSDTEERRLADPSCCDAARLYFLPTRRSDAEDGQVVYRDGPALDVSAILAEASPRAPLRELSDAGDLPPASPELLERCRRRLVDHGPAIEGQGGDRWTFSACAALIHGWALTEAEAWPLLLEWNAACEPPWDEDELRTKLENAASYASGPRGGERLAWEASEATRARLLAPAAAREASTRPTADYGETDWGVDDVEPSDEDEPPEAPADFDHGATLEALRAAVRGETLEPEYAPGFAGAVQRAQAEIEAELGEDVAGAIEDLEPMFVAALEVILRPIAATPWLVRGLLRDGGVAAIGAGPKVGKTWTALELGCAVATGTRAFGSDRFVAPRPCAVAYYFAEDDASAVAAHLRAYASGRQVPVEDLVRNLYLCPMGDHLNLRRTRDLARVVASCREIPSLALLILDPLRDVHDGKENDSDEMADVLGRLRFLARKLRATVLTPHHAKKLTREDLLAGAAMAGAALRGSSVIFGALDSTIMMALDEKSSDETHFVIDARAVIKGAKSAGLMGLKLTLVDDERDQAKHAQWEYRTGAEKRADDATEEIGEAAAADLAVDMIEHMRLVELRREPPRGKTKLRQDLKFSWPRLDAAIAHAQGRGWIHRPKEKWELTAAGRAVDLGGGGVARE